MDPSAFLPDWPVVPGPLLWLALLLLTATLLGEIIKRWLLLPRAVGYVIVGVALGPPGLGIVHAQLLQDLRIFVDIGLGLLLFELGQRIDLGWLRRNPWLLATSLLEASLAFAGVFALLLFLQSPTIVAALGGVLAASTSPAVVMTVVRDLRAQGQVTERMLMLTALNTAYAIVALAVIAAAWRAQTMRESGWAMLAEPLYLVFGSAALAAAVAVAALSILRLFGRNVGFQFVFLIGVVLTTVALVDVLKLSLPLTLLLMGVLIRALDRQRHFVALRLEEAGIFFIVILFSAFGASLTLTGTGTAWLMALLIVATRFVAKAAAILALSSASALPIKKAGLLAVGLMPASGFMLFLLQDLADVYPQLRGEAGVPVLLAATLLTMTGPLLAGFGIKAAGEASERPQA